MFGKKNKELEEARNTITELEARNRERENLHWEQIRKSDCEIDFKAINAFSIERTLNYMDENSVPVTVIRYINDKQICEWFIYCNDAIHAELVNKFRLSRE